MSTAQRLSLLVVLATALVSAPSAFAQVLTPAADMLEQDRLLGPGCNEIGLGMPSSNLPLQPSQEWLDSHSVCDGGQIKATGMCYGITDNADQVELCLFTSIQGDSSLTVGCDDMVLDTEIGLFGPHPALTDSLVEQAQAFSAERNITAGALFQPCTSNPALGENTFVFAAFDGLKPTNDPVVLRVNLETGSFVAVVADEPTLQVTATQ
jgi:hypothetical protein